MIYNNSTSEHTLFVHAVVVCMCPHMPLLIHALCSVIHTYVHIHMCLDLSMPALSLCGHCCPLFVCTCLRLADNA